MDYWKALKALRAGDAKTMVETSLYPHLKDNRDREKVQRSLMQSYTLNVSDGDYVKEREFEKILSERRKLKDE